MVMPGLSGQETCRRIRGSQGLRDVPLIMLTALEDRSAMIEGLRAGADDYISKSGEFEILKARVRAQMRRKQFEDENRRIREELLRTELEASEARAARTLAETRAALVEELERKNRDLEAFSYSVSHDLRAPLRSIDGFSQVVLSEYGGILDERGRRYLERVRVNVQRMGELIDDLLALARVGRADVERQPVSLSDLARDVMDELERREPTRTIEIVIHPGIDVEADPRLMRVALENLLSNAWKFTAKSDSPRIEVGVQKVAEAGTSYFVRDNGAGFDMKHADKLFSPFQRLHRADEFPGTGIGLATVQRVMERHGGRIWVDAALGRGATFHFTIPRARQ
jgi:two-component system, NtrC family, sensor kinase